jgi:anti-sigma B factor antagonist
MQPGVASIELCIHNPPVWNPVSIPAFCLGKLRVGDAIVLHCKGRIVFREEVVKLSQVVGESIETSDVVILDLKGVSAIDSAGLGEMVALHMWARGHGHALKMTGLSSRIRHLLELTNLTSVFEIYATEEEALTVVANVHVGIDSGPGVHRP